jgi:hypothetical protein
MDSDLYGSDDSDDGDGGSAFGGMDGRDLVKVSKKLYNDGYRVGKTAEEERQLQECFDGHYNTGAALGWVCGEVYARFVANLNATTPQEVSKSPVANAEMRRVAADTFLRDIPAAGAVSDVHIQSLRRAGVVQEVIQDLQRALNAAGLAVSGLQ